MPLPAAVRRLLDRIRARRLELTALLAMACLYFFSYFQRVAVPGTIFNELQTELGVSAAAVTALGAIFLYIYASVQVFVGAFTDRFGGGRVLLAGGLLLAVGSLLFPLGHSLWTLLALRALVGLGASVMYLSIVKEVDSLFHPRNFAPVLGTMLFVGYSGGMAGTFPCERAVNAWGWRTTFFAAGVGATLALGAAAWALRRVRHRRAAPTPFSWQMLAGIIANRRSLPVLLAGATGFAIYFVVQATIGKKFLEDVAGLSSADSATVTLVMMGTCMVVTFTTGLLTGLLGNRRRVFLMVACGLHTLAAALVLLGLHRPEGTPFYLTGYLLFAVAAGFAPIYVCAMKDVNAPEAVGLSIGVLNGVCYLAVAGAANAVGLLLAHWREEARVTVTAVIYPPAAYHAVMLLVLGLALIALLSSCFARDVPTPLASGPGAPAPDAEDVL